MKTRADKKYKVEVGVKTLLFNKKGEFVVLYRDAKKYGFRNWCIPGGRMESHETVEECLKREVFEETGIKSLKIAKLIAVQDIFYKGRDGTDKHAVRVTMISRENRPNDLKISDEHTDAMYISLEKALKMKNLEPYLRKAIKDNYKTIMSFIKDNAKSS